MLPEGLGVAADGARAVLGEPLAGLALVAIAMATLVARRLALPATLTLFLLGAGASHWLPPSPVHAALAAGLLAAAGVPIAAGWHAGRGVQAAAAAAGGLVFGLAAGLPLALGAEAAGSLALGALALALLLAAATPLLRRWPGHVVLRFAPRIVGAWIAAIGLLLMALQLWGRRG